jgi:hypothetical protein
MPRAPLTLAILLSAAGCAATGEIAPFDPTSNIEIGTGESEFVPLEDDDELEVVLGVQGGYHVVGNARVRGYADGVRFTVMSYDGLPLNIDAGMIQTGLERQPDGTFVCSPGHHVLVGAEPQELDGTPALFTVDMLDAERQVVADERRVRLVFAGPAQ